MLYTIEINGKKYVVEISETHVQIVNENKVEELKTEHKEHEFDIPDFDWEVESQNKINEIQSPMPGTIIAIYVNKGDKVKKGSVLAVFESMKMENEIIADCDGAINEIFVKVGDKIKAKQKILFIS